MADKKIFKPGHSAPPSSSASNFFDELNLPPAAAEFLSIWYRHILAAIVVVVVVILTWSLSQQYIASRADQASEQLSLAMAIDDPFARAEALEAVADSYGRTGPGIWSRIELAHLARDAGDLEAAAGAYQELLGSVAQRDPRHPMVRLSLARILVELGRDEQALGHYRELADTPGFEAWGLLGTGDILARQGETEAARQSYRQVAEEPSTPSLLQEQAQLRLRLQ